MPQMLDMGDQYGRATATALRKSKKSRAQQEAELLNQFAQGGGSADQMLRLKSDINRQGLEAEGDIMSTMGLEGAGQQFAANEARNAQQFAANEARNAMEYQGGLEKELQTGEQSFQERMWGKQNEYDRQREEEEMKQRRLETWLGLAGSLGGPILGAVTGGLMAG